MNRQLPKVIRTYKVVSILVTDSILMQNWSMLHAELGLPPHNQMALRWNLNRCAITFSDLIREIIEEWISRTAEPTMGMLINALRRINHNYAADQLVSSFSGPGGDTLEFRAIQIGYYLHESNEISLNQNQVNVNANQVVVQLPLCVMDLDLD